MNTILYAIAVWVLLQLIVVWLGTRVAGVRRLYVQDNLARQAHLASLRARRSDRSLLERDRPLSAGRSKSPRRVPSAPPHRWTPRLTPWPRRAAAGVTPAD
jgi:hypothetical protein